MAYSIYTVQEPSWIWSLRPITCVGRASFIVMLCLFASPSLAEQLDGAAVRELALQGTWQAQNDWGYWSWSEDGSVCLRMIGPEGDCADTGTWHIDGDVMCYELTWWGSSYDIRTNCYTVHSLGDGNYETRYYGGALDSVFTKFSVVN